MATPTTTVTRTNVLAGPATLYYGMAGVGTAEPTDAAVNAAPAASAWRDMGGTDGGLTVSTAQSFFVMRVDQIPDPLGRRLTERDVTVKTNLAEGTLENLSAALNDSPSASAITTGGGFKKYSLVPGQSIMFPYETAIMVDGQAPGVNKRRRVIGRRMVSIENIEAAYKKDGLWLFPVTFGAAYVDNATSPVVWIDEV